MPFKNQEDKRRWQSLYHKENPHIKKISEWKCSGIKLRKNEDWESIYLFWKTCERCEECNIYLTDGVSKVGRCLDHDHETGFIRNILCNTCNIKRG